MLLAVFVVCACLGMKTVVQKWTLVQKAVPLTLPGQKLRERTTGVRSVTHVSKKNSISKSNLFFGLKSWMPFHLVGFRVVSTLPGKNFALNWFESRIKRIALITNDCTLAALASSLGLGWDRSALGSQSRPLFVAVGSRKQPNKKKTFTALLKRSAETSVTLSTTSQPSTPLNCHNFHLRPCMEAVSTGKVPSFMARIVLRYFFPSNF